jgi:hypothetical protein
MTLRFRGTWLLFGSGFLALVIYLSLTPDPLRAPTVGAVKSGHLLAYFWVMFWFCQLYGSLRSRVTVALGLAALGIGLEYAQGLTSYRTFAYGDMVDDALGIFLGWVLAWTPASKGLAFVERWFLRTAACWRGAGD